MSEQGLAGLEARINALGLITGNQILDNSNAKNPVSANLQLWAGTNGGLTAGIQQPFALGAAQSTITAALFSLSGRSQGGVLTQTIVNGADVTTATKAHFVRVDVTDDNSVVVGSFYLELFTIT